MGGVLIDGFSDCKCGIAIIIFIRILLKSSSVHIACDFGISKNTGPLALTSSRNKIACGRRELMVRWLSAIHCWSFFRSLDIIVAEKFGVGGSK